VGRTCVPGCRPVRGRTCGTGPGVGRILVVGCIGSLHMEKTRNFRSCKPGHSAEMLAEVAHQTATLEEEVRQLETIAEEASPREGRVVEEAH